MCCPKVLPFLRWNDTFAGVDGGDKLGTTFEFSPLGLVTDHVSVTLLKYPLCTVLREYEGGVRVRERVGLRLSAAQFLTKVGNQACLLSLLSLCGKVAGPLLVLAFTFSFLAIPRVGLSIGQVALPLHHMLPLKIVREWSKCIEQEL